MTSPGDVDLWAHVPPPDHPSTEPPAAPAAYLWSWWETRAGSYGWRRRGLLTTTVHQQTLDTLTLGGRVAGALADADALRRPPDTFQEVLDRITHKFVTPDPDRRPPLRLIRGGVR